MPELSFLLRGWLIGIAIAAPVGPIGVLCIRRTLMNGRLIGFLSGLGAATADMLYGAIAAFGITALQTMLLRQQAWLRLLGGLFLLYLGVRTFFAKSAQPAAASSDGPGKIKAYLSTLGLTLTNPATILSFTVIFAGLRLGETGGNYAAAAFMVAGVFIGSATWWLCLSGIVGVFRERFTGAGMLWINRLAGVVIASFGVAALFLP
jgi:threonine/homoserine/homoserine lactone efflux protein